MFYDSLIKFLSPFFAENEIKANEDGTFNTKDKKIQIKYNEQTKCYDLLFAEEGEELKVVSSYLFDETQTEKDVESVAMDFTDTLRKKLSIAKSARLPQFLYPLLKVAITLTFPVLLKNF